MSRKEEIKKKAIEMAMPCFNGECKDFIDDPCMGTPCYAIERYEAAISMAEWADQNPREGLWDSEKVLEWLALHCELYGGFNQGKLNSMCEDLRKAMEG